MANYVIGEKKAEVIEFNFGKVLDAVGAASTATASFSAMCKYAKAIIIKAAGQSAVAGGSPYVFAGITAKAIAVALITYAMEKSLNGKSILKLVLYYEYKEHKLMSHGVITVTEGWQIVDYDISVK